MFWCHNVSKLGIVFLFFVMGVIMSLKFEFHLVDVMVSVSRDLRFGVIVSVSCESFPLRVRASVKHQLHVVGS